YAITSVFTLLQQLTQRKGELHPKPNERQYILISSLQKYLNMYKGNEKDVITRHAYMTMSKAGKKMGLVGSGNLSDLINNAFSLRWVDDVVNETGIRKYQHNFKLNKS